jgi:DNA-binding NarL/FixJ family response regulator
LVLHTTADGLPGRPTADTMWERSVCLMSVFPPKATPIRVLLVDDHAMMRQGLHSALKEYSNIEIVGEASDGEQAVSYAARLQPAVVVMDLNMSKMDGITATRLIKAQFPQIAVIGLSVMRKDYAWYAMERAGAFQVIPKENAVLDLYAAIQRAVAAVQPILVMQESPASKPSDTNELLSKTQPLESPKTGQE